MAAFWGNVRLVDGSHVGGDVAAMGGELKRSPSATVSGDQAAFGKGQVIAGALVGLVITGGFIALVVWLMVILFRRRRAPPAQAAFPRAS